MSMFTNELPPTPHGRKTWQDVVFKDFPPIISPKKMGSGRQSAQQWLGKFVSDKDIEERSRDVEGMYLRKPS